MKNKTGKETIYEVSSDPKDNREVPKIVPWEVKNQEMTQEEVEQIQSLNWEWYYNCYLYGDQKIVIACKRCGRYNWFEPGEKIVTCTTCGEKCTRCEKEEL